MFFQNKLEGNGYILFCAFSEAKGMVIKMNDYYKDKCVFILGAGQIGIAIALQILKYKPKALILHTYTEKEAEESIVKIREMAGTDTEVSSSYGDAFLPYLMTNITEKSILYTEENKIKLLQYYYSEPNSTLLKTSSIYQLICRWKPDIIIDSINTATIFGDDYNIYSSYIENNSGFGVNINKECLKNAFDSYLLDNFVPKIINFILSLKLGIEEFKIRKYIKVSTTGLGGMGMNLRFSHGDLVNYCLSNAIMGKIAVAGMLHQLLLSLSHTPGFNISVIVPATCVGWEDSVLDTVENNLGLIKAIDNINPQKLNVGERLNACKENTNKELLKIPIVSAGENKSYSLGEIAALTSYGQMESVTKEEVADAVIKCLNGLGSNDILKLMDLGSLHSSYKGRRIREILIDKLKIIENESGIPSIATGNLGPTTAKHLCELYLFKLILKNSLNKINELTTELLWESIHNEIFKNKEVRMQILSIGLPILVEDDSVLIGEKWMVPENNECCLISSDNIENWARKGWVDLRFSSIQCWQNKLIELVEDVKKAKNSCEISLVRDGYEIIDNFDVGEILAYCYILEGAGRRLYSYDS